MINYRRKFVLLLVLICFTSIAVQKTKAVITASVKTLKCNKYNEIVESFSCVLKPTRNKLGNVTLSATVNKPISDLWANVVVYYKYRVFQKFMVDLDIDVCGIYNSGLEFNTNRCRNYLVKLISF